MSISDDRREIAIEEAIEDAILAERQRCADIATKEGNGYRDNNLPLCAMGAYQVSKAILAGAE